MKKAVIYARYSSDSQTEQSIEGQLRICNDYARNNDIIIVGTYIDRAMTGTNDNRPDFKRMIADSSSHTFEYVIVYKLDRFSRNKYETTIHRHTLKENGVKVLSAMENIPDTPEGIILESMLEGMNQYYSAELSQKVHRGLNESYLKGNYTGGPVNYGYDVVDKKNVINPQEAEVVREIFIKYSQGYTAVDIASNLKARNIKTKEGLFITDKKIYKIIANQKYIGKVKHGETVYTNIYPAIIDEITWQRVQNLRESQKHIHGKKKDKFNYILSGKLICGYCKHYMVGEGGKEENYVMKYRYYSCLSKRRRKIKCPKISEREFILVEEVMDIIMKVLADKENLKKIAKDVLKTQTREKGELSVKALESNKNVLVKSTNNLISALEQGIITEQTKFRLKELETQIKEIDAEIEKVKQENKLYITEDDVYEFFEDIISKKEKNDELNKLLIKVFVRNIILYNDAIVIIFNYSNSYISSKTTDKELQEIDKIVKNTTFEEGETRDKLIYFCGEKCFGVKKQR